VKDFDYLHLSQKSDPVIFYFSKGSPYDPLIASIVPGRTQDAIAFLQNLHEETVGGEFTYSFVEDEVNEMYKEDKKIASIYSFFTFIAIFISTLGLLSMSLFDIQQRRKEIAIRKINGASLYDVIRLLLKKYLWSVAGSFIIAAPVALFAINRYLEDFAHKAPVSWWLFAVAVVITAGISLLTLIYQTLKAAGQNPANVVKFDN
jgi:ABC-type antimicrobial peptide transport system permease subunit